MKTQLENCISKFDNFCSMRKLTDGYRSTLGCLNNVLFTF